MTTGQVLQSLSFLKTIAKTSKIKRAFCGKWPCWLLIRLLIGLLVIISICGQLACRNSPDAATNSYQADLNVRFKKISESFGNANILIPPDDFSRQNIESLCLWYHHKYKAWPRNLSIQIFTNEEAFDSFVESQRRSQTPGDADPPKILDWNRFFQARKKSYSAVCLRAPSDPLLESDAFASSSGFDLVLWYTPNLSESNPVKAVVLRGSTHTEGKYNKQIYQFHGKTGKIVVASYDIYNVEPSTRYYSFTYLPLSSSSNYSKVIFNIRFDATVDVTANQVKFYDDKKVSAYMGWMYSVTIDAGKTWYLWDAERDLPGWKCCNPGLIKSVSISDQGVGQMILQIDPNKHESQIYLRTTDFGQHWIKQ